MSDDSLFEYLHMSIVQYFNNIKKNKEEIREALEALGFRVGYGLIEKMSPDTARLIDEVSIMKYICKEFWISLYMKQIDNLRTNNQGIFVLQDNNFRFLTHMSAGKQYIDVTERYLAFSCGVLRGALTNLGYPCVVTADVQQMPICRFQINLLSNQQPQQAQTSSLPQTTPSQPSMTTSVSVNQLSSLNTSMASMSISKSPTSITAKK